MKKYLIFSLLPILGHAMLISSPFDNFRIECPQNSGAQRLSIKMVESQGMKRQDTVFALSCNRVDEIYPWSDIPQGLLEMEREDCHYTNMFDPIMDVKENASYTCGPREYLAGITRVTDTRIQTMCCRLRTRDEINCESVRFGKPLGYDGKVEIQMKGKLINALNVEQNLYKVRFCDLAPRALGEIMDDVRTTTTARPSTTTSKPSSTTVKESVAPTTEQTQFNELSANFNDIIQKQIDDTIQNLENQEFELSKLEENPSDIETNTTTAFESSAMSQEASQEKRVLSPSLPSQNTSNSFEVQASPMPLENVFPSDKDYENIEEAEAELMSTIADMIKARSNVKNLITNVRAAGIKQQVKQKQEEMAEKLLREIEGEADPAKADELFKQSIEMLNELSEAKEIMSTEEFSKEMMKQEERKITEEIQKSDTGSPLSYPATSSFVPPLTSTLPPLTSSIPPTTIPPLATMSVLDEYSSNTALLNDIQLLSSLKSNHLFFKKHSDKLLFKQGTESEPSKEFLAAASKSTESRRAPVKHSEKPLPTLPPFDNFPSPPSNKRPAPLELPRAYQSHEEYRPATLDFNEYDEFLRPTTPFPYFYKTYKKPHSISFVAPNARGNFVDQPYVDELTKNSPFESSYENRNISPLIKHRNQPETQSLEITTAETYTEAVTTPYVPVFETDAVVVRNAFDKSPFDFREIRRAPVPRRTEYEEYQTPFKKSDEIKMDTKDGDGILSFEPPANKEMKIEKAEEVLHNDEREREDATTEYQNEEENGEKNTPEAIKESPKEANVFAGVETLVPMNAIEDMVSQENKEMNLSLEEAITFKPTTIKPSTNPPTTVPQPQEQEPSEYFVEEYQEADPPQQPTYDPRSFYHTLPPRPVKRTKYLTFCTKDLAIRDEKNMIVACGSDNEVWVPKRCPEGTDCFYTTDSTFRICCPVASG